MSSDPAFVALRQAIADQQEAAERGDLDALSRALASAPMPGAAERLAAGPAGMAELAACNAKTIGLVNAWAHRVGAELAALRRGANALTGYRPPVEPARGLLDQRR